jgi:hypothetical protein
MEASHLLSCILFVPALPTSWLFLVCLLDHLKSCLFLVWVAHMISCGGLAYMIKQQTDDKGGKRGVSEVWGANGLRFSEIPEPPPTR